MKKAPLFIFTMLVFMLTMSVWWDYARYRIPMFFAGSIFFALAFLAIWLARYYETKYFFLLMLSVFLWLFPALEMSEETLSTWMHEVPQAVFLPFVGAGLFAYILIMCDYKLLKIVLVISAIFILYTALKTSAAEVNSARTFFGNARTVENVAKAIENLEENVMGYAHVHSIPFIVAGVVCIFKRADRIYVKLFAAAFGLICIYALLKSGYTTATMATGLVFAMSATSARKRVIQILTVLLGIILFAIMVRTGMLLSILEGIEPLLPHNTALIDKIHEFAAIQTTVNGSEYWKVRSFLYQLSWEAFCEHPVFGSGIGHGGGHAFLLDLLGRGGIVCFMPFMVFYIAMYKFVSRALPLDVRWYFFSSFLALVLLSSFKGPGLIAQNHIIFFVLPLALVSNRADFQNACIRIRRQLRLPLPQFSPYS